MRQTLVCLHQEEPLRHQEEAAAAERSLHSTKCNRPVSRYWAQGIAHASLGLGFPPCSLSRKKWSTKGYEGEPVADERERERDYG
jgi:hypothetical protein